MGKITMNTDKLAQFLNAANKATYANKDAPKVAPSRLKSEDYHFEQDGLIYRDFDRPIKISLHRANEVN